MNADALREIRKVLDITAEDIERIAAKIEREDPNGSLDLVGIAEISTMTGLKPKTISARKTRGRMPRPVAELAMGSVWLRSHISEWWAGEQ